ncbi:MAG TPA: signal peptidase I [Sedimentisphaerales bacterium]|nr:signal peptidase I [Sedimentisphaerales bacterium]
MDTHKAKKYVARLWKEWRLTVFLIIFVVIPVKSSLADWNWVPTGSMNPTILEGDLIYVDKVAYGLRFPLTLHRLAKWSDPQRGDIVVCFSPEDGTRLVKRIIGLPGDTIELKNNRLFLNGQPLNYRPVDSRYIDVLSPKQKNTSILATEDLDGLAHPVMSTPAFRAMRNFGPATVPQGYYFVLGDNRDNSRDSRFFGFVERNAIVGEAKGIIVSFDITDKYQPRFRRFLHPLD